MRRSVCAPWVVVVVAGCVVGAGCVDRRIFITSEPEGARVYLNDQDVGLTPLEVNFTWFGTYDVRLRKAGYEPLVTTAEAKAPLHEIPPFDFVAMAVPGTKRTHIDWHFELTPATTDTSGLLERAGELRAEVEAEVEAESAPMESPTEPATESPSESPTEVRTESPAEKPASPGPDVIEVTPGEPGGSKSTSPE